MKTIPHLLIITLIFLFLFGCIEEHNKISPSGNIIKIGVLGPMSGPDEAMGKLSLEGIRTELHIQPFLKNGDSVQLIIEDDRNEPELAIKGFKKLVTVDKVKAVIVLSSSASSLEVNNLADSYQVPLLATIASHPEISKNTKFVSQLCFDDTTQGKVAALFVRDELLLDKVAVFKNPASFHSNSLANEFIRKFRETEGVIQDVILISSDPVDYETVLSRLQQQGVQLLYLPVEAKDVITIAKELRKMSWTPQVMGGDGLLENVSALKQNETHFLKDFLSIGLYSQDIEATSRGKIAMKVFRSLFRSDGSIYAAAGFEGMAILLDAMNRCHDPAVSECVNDRLHETVDFDGLMGKITIRPDGKVERPLIVNRIIGGHLKFIVKVY